METESFESKLYIPRSHEGDPNTNELADIRIATEKLDELPEFVSIVPQGSIVHGYSNDASDVDLAILYDSNGQVYNSKAYWQQRQELTNLALQAKNEIWDTRKDNSEPVRNIAFRLFDINTTLLESSVFFDGRYDNLAHIFQMSTGEKIGSYRHYWKERINTLPPAKKDEVISQLVDSLTSSDMEYNKLQARIPQTDIANLKQERQKLWENRLSKMLN